MCTMTSGFGPVVYIPATNYLTEAKRRNRRLKALKSVSRAYRKSCVRAIKAKAWQARSAP